MHQSKQVPIHKSYLKSIGIEITSGFFGPFENKLKDEKTQASTKKLKFQAKKPQGFAKNK